MKAPNSKVKPLIVIAAITTMLLAFSIFDSKNNSAYADEGLPAPDRDGTCYNCKLSNGTWGADIDCLPGTNTCTDIRCTSGFC